MVLSTIIDIISWVREQSIFFYQELNISTPTINSRTRKINTGGFEDPLGPCEKNDNQTPSHSSHKPHTDWQTTGKLKFLKGLTLALS